jgi:hypothetical protein
MAKKPKPPADRNLSKELGSINSTASDTFGQRNTQLQGAFTSNLSGLAQALNNARNSETSTNKKFIKKNLSGAIKQNNQALATLSGNVLNPTALETQTSNAASSALNQPQDQLLQALNGQAQSDLALGRSLSPEEIRQATQQARVSTAATGFAGSAPGTFAEVLNRDQFATAREAQRRAFAQGVEGQNQDATNSARSFAGQTNAEALQRALAGTQFGVAAANQRLATNPFMLAQQQQSLVPTAAGFNGSLINQADPYNAILSYGSDVNNTNYNGQESRYNSYLNNQAALQGAGLQASATSGAGGNAMLGSGLAAGGAIIGGVAIAI